MYLGLDQWTAGMILLVVVWSSHRELVLVEGKAGAGQDLPL